MFNNYELVKKSDLQALKQEIADLNNDIRTATDLLARYDHVLMEQQKLIKQQQKQIHELIGIDLDLDFPNSMKGGYQDQ